MVEGYSVGGCNGLGGGCDGNDIRVARSGSAVVVIMVLIWCC